MTTCTVTLCSNNTKLEVRAKLYFQYVASTMCSNLHGHTKPTDTETETVTTILRFCPPPVVFPPLGSFWGAERLCYFLLIHTQKPFAHARRVHNFTRARFETALVCLLYQTFWGSSGLPLGLSESLLLHLIVQRPHSTVTARGHRVTLSWGSHQEETASFAASADWINTNRHGNGISLPFSSRKIIYSKMKCFKNSKHFVF